ncbi:MAG TPA: hypothetical protein VK421_08740 [Pyrinomonadaceae bacterium]|nr:hypothetical protein [Pyrinomonadaceae bacterium]
MQNSSSYRRAGRGALATFLLLAAALLITAGQAHAQVVRTVDRSFTDSLVNPCTGETISFAGTLTTTSSVHNNGSRTNIRLTTDVKAKGTVTADPYGQPVQYGTSYKIQTRSLGVNDQLNPVAYPFQQSQVLDMKLVGAGNENNYFFRFNVRLVINAAGELSVYKENSDLRCENTIIYGSETMTAPTIQKYDSYSMDGGGSTSGGTQYKSATTVQDY